MKHNYFIKEFLRRVMTACILYLSATTLSAQIVRPYTTVYSDNLQGGHTIFGNTILARSATAMNEFIASPFGTNGITSTEGNDDASMQFVDIDGDASTFNSSSADLLLPAGTNTIKFARLYWGGRIDTTITIAANRNKVKIKKAGSSYNTIDAPLCQMDQYNVSGKQNVYQAYFDVTTFISMNGAGTYTVGDVALSTGDIGGGGYFGGWALVVVYGNVSKNYSSVRVYDGFLQVYDDGSPVTQSITLTGLNVPTVPTIASDATMSVMSWEGDANLAASSGNPNGDYMKINGVKVANNVNPIKNFWNGTISKNGAFVTTKNPNYKNQMGIDIDEQDVGVGFGFVAGTNNISVEFGTEADQYFPSLFAFSIIAKPASITLELAATTSLVPYNLLNPNEDITYTITGTNNGPGVAHNCVVIDTVPHCLTYKPGSLKFVSTHLDYTGIMTDAAGDDQAEIVTTTGGTYVVFRVGGGATSSTGGNLNVGDIYQLEFKCVTPANATISNSVADFARITGIDDTNNPLVDDGMVVLGPGGIPLAVKMKSFSVIKQGDNAFLQWVTESEIKNDKYEIEKSYDGINFVNVGAVKGSGTSMETMKYSFTDPITFATKVIFYRLKISDFDGKATYSWVESLRIDGGSIVSGMIVYPNPFTVNPKIQVYCEREAVGVLKIMNTAGQQVLSKKIKLNRGVNIVVLTEMNNLNPGLFVVDLMAADGIKLSQKLMKQ